MINWNGKRVLVTGGTGFIGSVLVEELLKLGAHVRVPIRAANYRSLSPHREKIEWVEGDLRSSDYCTQIVSGMDHVFHLASHRRNAAFHRKYCADVLKGNVEMTLAMVHALKEHPRSHVTFFSSANVPPKLDVIQVAQEESIDGFVLGKALCETCWLTAVRQYDFPLLIVRPVGVYGERDTFSEDSNVIPSLIVKAAKAKERLLVWGSGKQERVFLYVHDLVKAVFLLHEHDAAGIQYVMPKGASTVAHVAKTIRDLVNPGLPLEFDTSKPEGKRSLVVLGPHPCLKLLEWTPLEEGIFNTYQSWKKKKT